MAPHVQSPYDRVYGLYPCNGGFTFVVLEAPSRLVDWGKMDLGRDSDSEFKDRVNSEFTRYQPAAVAFEDGENSRRVVATRRRRLIAMDVATQLGMERVVVARVSIHSSLNLGPRATKHDIAAALCLEFPEMSARMPTKSIWKRDPRMHVFTALSLAYAAVAMSRSSA